MRENQMTFRGILKFLPVGLVLQIILFVLAFSVGGASRKAWASCYWIWIELGGILDNSSGSGGHAFQGGAILGFLLGVIIYSLFFGAIVYYFYKSYLKKPNK